MATDTIKDMREKMSQATQAFSKNLATVRAGRANPNILDSIFVDYYGASTPLNQLANVSTPEARLLVVTPYDKTRSEERRVGKECRDRGVAAAENKREWIQGK